MEAKDSSEAILEKHKRLLANWGIPSPSRLPFMYWLPKMHKDGERFIAASSKVSTSVASGIVCQCLKMVQNCLLEKDEELFVKQGIRRCFIIPSWENVAKMLSGWRRDKL